MNGRQQSGLTILLVSLILLIALGPLLGKISSRHLLQDAVFTVVFLSALSSIFENRKIYLIALLFAVPGLLSRWALYAAEQHFALNAIGYAGDIVFLSLCSVVLIKRIINAEQISIDIIFGSISAYILIGFAFARTYAAIDQFSPDAFTLPEFEADAPISERGRIFVYFSFVTLTTLGYGDIQPRGDLARTVSMLEAVLGEMYIAILVAALVGILIANKTNSLR